MELIEIRNLLADVATTAYMRGAAGQSHGNPDTDPYAGRILALTAKARAEGAAAELVGLNAAIAGNGWHKENAYKMFPYIAKRLAALQSQEDGHAK